MATNDKHLDVAVGKKALRVVPINLLNVDPSYQRGVSPNAKKIAANFDPDALGVPLVGQREDDTLWTVDGQQRIVALGILGKKSVRCDVFVSRGPEHEARVFKFVNMGRTRLRNTELFHALLTAGDEACHAVKGIVEKAGFKIPKSGVSTTTASDEHRANSISAVGVAVRAYEKQGADCLRFILDVISASWPDDPLRVKTEILEGLMFFYVSMSGAADRDRLIARLQHTTPAKLIYSAGLGIGSRGQNVAEAITKVYRKKHAGPK